MLGQPVYFLTPDVVGVQPERQAARRRAPPPTSCSPSPRCCARRRWSASSSSSSARAPRRCRCTDRATIANMAPEYGATMGFFPVDDETRRVLPRHRPHRRARSTRFEAYFKAQGMFGMPKQGDIDYSQVLELDLATVVPVARRPEAPAGPHRPRQGEGELRRRCSPKPVAENGFAQEGRRPAQARTRPRRHRDQERRRADRRDHLVHQHLEPERAARRGPAREEGGRAGLTVKPHIKTSLAPGSRVVTEYLTQGGPAALPREARLQRRRLRLHDLHRQRRPARRSDRRSDRQERPGLRGGALRQPQLRGAHPSEHPRQLPRLAAAGGGLRDRRHDADRLRRPSRSASARTARTCSSATSGRPPTRSTALMKFAMDAPTFRRLYSDLANANPLWKKVSAPTRPGLQLAEVDLHRRAAVLRRTSR